MPQLTILLYMGFWQIVFILYTNYLRKVLPGTPPYSEHGERKIRVFVVLNTCTCFSYFTGGYALLCLSRLAIKRAIASVNKQILNDTKNT